MTNLSQTAWPAFTQNGNKQVQLEELRTKLTKNIFTTKLSSEKGCANETNDK